VNPLETIENLIPDQITLVASCDVESGKIKVQDGAGFRWLVSGGRSVQTLMLLAVPTKLLLPNHIAMLFGLLLIDDVDSLLSLGMGGGSFERFFRQHYPQCSITSVESNHEIIQVAHDYFGVPTDLRVVSGYAQEYVRTTKRRYDLVLCDIFEREKNPACLSDPDFYQDIKSKLSPEGVLVLNTIPESDQSLLVVLQALRVSFSLVYLCPVSNHGNMVIVAKDGVALLVDQLQERAQKLTRRVELPLVDWVDKFQLIPEPNFSPNE